MFKLSRVNSFDCYLNQQACRFKATKVVSGELENCETPTGQVLLITNVLIRRDKQIEVWFCLLQQVTVSNLINLQPERSCMCDQPVSGAAARARIRPTESSCDGRKQSLFRTF